MGAQTREMSSPQAPVTDHHPSRARGAAALLALALVAAAMWAAWLGWDTEYYEVDGSVHGPYREWQVIGCALSIAAAAIVVQVRLRRTTAVALAAAATVGFAVPWTVQAAATDDSGLFVVGLLMLLVGGVLSLTVVLTITGAVLGRRHPRGTSGSDRG